MRITLSRVALVVVAIVACGWLAGSLRSLNRSRDATASLAVAVTHRDGAGVRRAQRDFAAARRFGNDANLLLTQAQVLAYARRPRQALPLVMKAVREEPENATAWILLAVASRTQNPALARRARSRAIALDPRVGDRR